MLPGGDEAVGTLGLLAAASLRPRVPGGPGPVQAQEARARLRTQTALIGLPVAMTRTGRGMRHATGDLPSPHRFPNRPDARAVAEAAVAGVDLQAPLGGE